MHRKFTYFLKCMHSTLLLGCILSFGLLFYSKPTIFDMLRNFFLIVPILLGGIVIDRIQSIFLYLLFSGCCIGTSFLLGTTEFEQLAYPMATALVCYLWFRKRNSPNQYCWLTDIHFLILFPFLVLYILAMFLECEAIQQTIYYAVFLYSLCLLLHSNLNGFEKFLQKHADRANIPLQQIQSSNDVLLFLFGTITILIFLVIPYSGLSQILSTLGKCLYAIYRWIVNLLARETPPPILPIEPTEESSTILETMTPEPTEPSPIAALIGAMFLFVGIFLLVAGIIAAIAYIVYTIYKGFHSYQKNTSDKTEFLPIKPNAFQARKTKSQQPLTEPKSPSHQVRRIYKKSILTLRPAKKDPKKPKWLQTQKFIPPRMTMTPTEIEQDTKLKSNASAQLLHITYEKARYSKQGCTNEETAQLKKQLKTEPLQKQEDSL